MEVEKKRKGRKPGVKKIVLDEQVAPKKVSFFKDTKKVEEKQNLVFNLPPMNIISIDKKYDIDNRIIQKSFNNNISTNHTFIQNSVPNVSMSVNNTKIDDSINSMYSIDDISLIKSKLIPDSFLFFDYKNKEVPLYYNCRNHKTLEALPLKTNILCYWCRHSFNTCPIGIPVNYHPSEYIQEFSKLDFLCKGGTGNDAFGKKNIIKTKLTIKQREKYENNIKEGKMSGYIIKKEYFDVDGIFCSFNCAYAFVKDSKEFIYRDSYTYLLRLAKLVYGRDVEIKPSLHWRMLTIFGGNMDIDIYRKASVNLDIVYLQPTKLNSNEIIKFKPSNEMNSVEIENETKDFNENKEQFGKSLLPVKPICHSFYIRE